MRIHARLLLSVVCLLLLAIGVEKQTTASLAVGNQRAKIVEGYGKLPLAFEANQGQSDSQVKFLSRGAGYSLFLTSADAVLALQPSAVSHRRSVLRMELLNANPNSVVTGQDELPGKSNYFLGRDPKKWHREVRQYAKVRYANVYPGVDLVYYGNQHELEYDFVLQPGADPRAIRLGIKGQGKLRLEHGDLVLTDVRLRSPRVYQETNGIRQEVRGRYVITSKNKVGFRLGTYDRRRALVIDPVLAYSTYLGGSGGDVGNGIAVDLAGSAYITGETYSSDFPTANAIQPSNAGGGDVFVTKFNAEGTALVYSTYLGGSGYEWGNGIALDSTGNAYVTGATNSTDFPTVNAIQPTFGGSYDAFVSKINNDGSALVYSTYLGGSGDDEAFGIAVDSAGNAYVTGETSSTDFPTYNAIQAAYGGNRDAFVAKINAAASGLVYSTYLGGSERETAGAIAVDLAGNAYVAGATFSTDFPTKNAFQATNHGGADAFVTKINATGRALVYSTYLGGSNYEDAVGGTGFEGSPAIAVDSEGNVYVAGWTLSTDFPTLNAIQPIFGGGEFEGDGFVTKLNSAGRALVYSTYLGGNNEDGVQAIAVDAAGNAYVTGFTASTNFPVVNAIQPKLHGSTDAFATEINARGSALVYSTYLGGGGGLAVDSVGSIYITGRITSSSNFPTTPVAFQLSNKSRPNGPCVVYPCNYTAFVTKIAGQTFVGVSTKKLFFPAQVVGTTSNAKKITVTNQGAGTLTINDIFVGGLNAGDFAETNTCGATLPPSATCTVYVTFTPTAKEARNAGMGVSSSDPASPDAVGLSGPGTVVSLSKKGLSFGSQQVGTSPAPQNVILTNVDSTPLKFTGITITGTNASDYSQSNTCATSIAAKANCTITVTFTPTATGKRTAAVSIGDDGGGSPQKIQLTGTGT